MKSIEELLGLHDGPLTYTCEICGNKFEPEDLFESYRACSRPCLTELEARDDIERAAYRQKQIEELRDEAAAVVRQKTPSRLSCTDLAHAGFNRKAWAAVSKWRPTDVLPFLGLVGATGTCKTRMSIMQASAVLADMFEASNKRLKFESSSAYLIARFAIDQYSDNAESKRDTIRSLNDIRRADLLIIDDLDKTRFSPAITEVLFEIIDHRHGSNKPTIWTANSTAEEIGGMMAPQFGPAFAGRLNDCSKTYFLK